ncbi:ATP-dependent DNA helicase [Candidatus Woesearchaeota archaeon]|nr:ATP-dependent DNA helicase [Candidatus Woesearchaeota archaeon]
MKLFPFSKIRPEQDELLKEISNSIENKQHLIVHAPTGLGKTAAALVPALEHAIKNNLTVFFLTSRHTQHIIAVETLKKIKEEHDAKFVITDLVGKKNMCMQDGVFALKSGEFHEYCKKLREEEKCAFYTNTKSGQKSTPKADVLISEIKNMRPLHTEQINELCREKEMCPYEIATALAKDSSVVIADYSYIFKDSVRNSLFRRIQKNLGECIVIVDEAHNLPKRIIDSATEKLSAFILKRAIQECNKFEYSELAVKLTSILDSFGEIANKLKQENKGEMLVSKEEVMKIVNDVQDYEELCEELEKAMIDIIEQQKQTFLASVLNFLISWKGPDEGFARIFSVKDKKMSLMYKCLDPGLFSKGVINQTRATIAMSGTLTPTEMYRDLLGFENVVEKVFKSPFPDENKLSLIVPKTTTKFTARSDEQYEKIANAVAEITNIVPGNSVVFFPSYSIRDNVFKYFTSKTDKTTFLETPNMNKQEKIEMLEKFKEYSKSGAVLLGASSGNFSEGIDLLGDLLKCVVVVGLPLQQPDLETQEAIKYYDKKFGKGWDYGYIFPAFNKVLQGAGRCIRSETDRGVVVYLDERYSWPNYIRCFPEDINLTIKKDYLEEIREFFEK